MIQNEDYIFINKFKIISEINSPMVEQSLEKPGNPEKPVYSKKRPYPFESET